MTSGKTDDWRQRPQPGLIWFGTHISNYPHYDVIYPLPQMNMTETISKEIPLESARAGAKDDSQHDPSISTALTRISRQTSESGKTLLACSCGWQKVTTLRGLKIHQGKKGCLNDGLKGNRIDGYFLRSQSNQSNEDQRPDSHHSSQDLNSSLDLVSDSLLESQHLLDTNPGNQDVPRLPKQSANHVTKTRPQVKWPRSSENVWKSIDEDLIAVLRGLRGTAEGRLEVMADLIYNYGADRFGTRETKAKAAPIVNISRRQKEITQLIKERRQLRKSWKKASEVEKEGINFLQKDIKIKLASLRRAENLRKKRRNREKTRTRFYREPFKFVKSLFIKEKGGELKISKEALDEHIKTMYSDSGKNEMINIPPDIPLLEEIEHGMDIDPPRLKEVKLVVKKARNASAPGPNGIPYLFYKNSPGVLVFLWKLMGVVWKKGVIPVCWRRAGGVLIPKERDSTEVNQFRPISLLNVEGKIFFSVLAQRMTKYLLNNQLIDTQTQKAGITGFAGCLEHTSMIWHQIQSAKKEKKELHVVFLDLANAFSSVPHNFIWASFNFFKIPDIITNLVKAYFSDLQLCFTTPAFVTDWHRLEIGIMAGCTVSPLAFTIAMEIIIRASKWVVRGERLKSGNRLTPIRAFMDDTTTLTTSKLCTRRLLNKLQENITNAKMKIKSCKSRSISIVRGKLTDVRFSINNEPIPTVMEKPIKSLGRWYDSKLKDTDRVKEIEIQVGEGLRKIDNTSLPGKLKIWCLQFGLMPRLIWPLTMYDASLTNIKNLERKISAHIRKWLGVPRSLSSVGLYGKGLLELPLSSLTEEYKCAKVRLQVMLTESKDEAIKEIVPTQKTGRKWRPEEAAQIAIASLKHKDIVGLVQHGTSGLGMSGGQQRWLTSSVSDQRKMVVNEIRNQEEQQRCAITVSQAKQGQWMRWEGLEKRKLSWADLWAMESSRISFLLRAVYDVLPTPKNLHQWLGEDPSCPLCGASATLRHILASCKISLSQQRYTWRHNAILQVLAAAIDIKRNHSNTKAPKHEQTIAFVRQGQKIQKLGTVNPIGILEKANDWILLVDLKRRLIIPTELATSSLRPDMILYSTSSRRVYIIELTIPWEDSIFEAYERKKTKYSELASEMKDNGWNTSVCPVEVTARGFVAKSTINLLKELGFRGRGLRQITKDLSTKAEYTSRFLWLMRKEKNWANR